LAANASLFSGDSVDGGSFCVEILASRMAWKLLDSNWVYLNSGNHETEPINLLYGFENEWKQKYGSATFSEVMLLFHGLPLGRVLVGKVIVVHGGLFWDETATIESLQRENCDCQPRESVRFGEILWNKRMEESGYGRSPRWLIRTFGPDVMARFLSQNGLEFQI
jgi:serine/threonine-protein phosphatase 5